MNDNHEEALRTKRRDAFVTSPQWRNFDGGKWRRYHGVRVVSRRTAAGKYEGGFLDGGSWRWTGPRMDEESALRTLFDQIEAIASAAKPAKRRAPEVELPEDWDSSDWILEPPLVLTDEHRAEIAEDDAKITAMVREHGWILRLPRDFPSLPDAEGETAQTASAQP